MSSEIKKDLLNATNVKKTETPKKKEIKLKEPRIKMSFTESTAVFCKFATRSAKRDVKKDKNKF